jgi:peptidoglycan/xylan/chitin deacetylase (PgdA/CDA1 family)
VAAAGHTIGSATWSLKVLTDKKWTEEQRKEEIEKGFSAVKLVLGGVSPAPFFRFPNLQRAPEMVTYLGSRNIAIFSTDVESLDFKASTSQEMIDRTMQGLGKVGKGIVRITDTRRSAEALPELLSRLKAGGYKIVQIKAKAPVQTIASYDEAVVRDMRRPSVTSTK